MPKSKGVKIGKLRHAQQHTHPLPLPQQVWGARGPREVLAVEASGAMSRLASRVWQDEAVQQAVAPDATPPHVRWMSRLPRESSGGNKRCLLWCIIRTVCRYRATLHVIKFSLFTGRDRVDYNPFQARILARQES